MGANCHGCIHLKKFNWGSLLGLKSASTFDPALAGGSAELEENELQPLLSSVEDACHEVRIFGMIWLYTCLVVSQCFTYVLLFLFAFLFKGLFLRKDPEVCPDSQRASGQAKMKMMMMMKKMMMISSWNPIRNPNDCMTVWLIVPWGRGTFLSSWNPIRNPSDCMVNSIWYVEATCSCYMICRSNMFWLTP